MSDLLLSRCKTDEKECLKNLFFQSQRVVLLDIRRNFWGNIMIQCDEIEFLGSGRTVAIPALISSNSVNILSSVTRPRATQMAVRGHLRSFRGHSSKAPLSCLGAEHLVDIFTFFFFFCDKHVHHMCPRDTSKNIPRFKISFFCGMQERSLV